MEIQNSFSQDKNKLYIVSTPIGNLSDISYRAIEILKSVDLILCEDTRVTGKLLSYFEIKNKMESYQKFNEASKTNDIISKIKEGMNVALVSDAGTPLINDPGFILVKEAINLGVDVVSIPGASAVLTALASSGLLPQPFTFVGFSPRKSSEIKTLLTKYINREETLIFYESPLRISKTLSMFYEVLGDRRCVLGRELTKKFETFYRGNLIDMVNIEFDTRGEYVILLEGKEEMVSKEINVIHEVNKLIESGLDEKEALKIVAKQLGVHKSEIYKQYKLND